MYNFIMKKSEHRPCLQKEVKQGKEAADLEGLLTTSTNDMDNFPSALQAGANHKDHSVTAPGFENVSRFQEVQIADCSDVSSCNCVSVDDASALVTVKEDTRQAQSSPSVGGSNVIAGTDY